jgi:lipopolysaccharide/colanic/teichoic acid biosynthesis glycosyltransferase
MIATGEAPVTPESTSTSRATVELVDASADPHCDPQASAVASLSEKPPPVSVATALAVCPPVASTQPAAISAGVVDPADILPAALAEEAFDLISDFSSRLQLSLKRVLDVTFAATALLVLSPLLLLIAAIIKLTDGGPVFFAQQRVGFRYQSFRMLKFRSMVIHAESLKPKLQLVNEANGPVFKMRRDPRVTKVGRILRKYSLDELPQLINVLRGEMSIVGPRPSLEIEVARYEPWYFRRFAVRPGLTCFWQICARRYRMPFDDWMRLDLKYVDQWSLRLDLKLIARTFAVVLGGTGE